MIFKLAGERINLRTGGIHPGACLSGGDPAATSERAKIHIIDITDRKLSRQKCAMALPASRKPHAGDPQCGMVLGLEDGATLASVFIIWSSTFMACLSMQAPRWSLGPKINTCLKWVTLVL
jgi:hypothetical protein